MTDDDATSLARLASGLASIDLDDARADAIARRAADQLGRASRRGADLLAVSALSTGYLAWVLVHVLDVFG